MNDISRKNLEQAMNDCFDRADVCPADSEDYFKLLDKASKIAALLNEQEKLEFEKELETKKFEETKIWKDPKFLITVFAPLVTQFVFKVYDRNTLIMQTKNICQFEKDNTFTTYAGKGIGGIFRFPSINK